MYEMLPTVSYCCMSFYCRQNELEALTLHNDFFSVFSSVEKLH